MQELLQFAPTYLCESGFSQYAQMKTKYHTTLDATSDIGIQLLSRTFQNCCSPENKYIALTNKTGLLLNCLCFMVTFIVYNFVYSTKP